MKIGSNLLETRKLRFQEIYREVLIPVLWTQNCIKTILIDGSMCPPSSVNTNTYKNLDTRTTLDEWTSTVKNWNSSFISRPPIRRLFRAYSSVFSCSQVTMDLWPSFLRPFSSLLLLLISAQGCVHLGLWSNRTYG